MLALLAAPTQAQQNNLLDFSRLNLVGSAARSNDRLRLTSAALEQTGAAWYDIRQNVQAGFDTTFRFQVTAPGGILDPNGNDGGDGFAFVIQNESPFVLGGPGAGIGYAGITNSVAIEFDTWLNRNFDVNDPDGSHVSVHTAGTQPNAAQEAFSLGLASFPSLANQQVHTARIAYVPGTLNVFVDDLANPLLSLSSFDLGQILNLQNNSNAYLGFTSATAAAYENHDILAWSLGPSASPAIPEAGTCVLLITSVLPLCGAGALRRRCCVRRNA